MLIMAKLRDDGSSHVEFDHARSYVLRPRAISTYHDRVYRAYLSSDSKYAVSLCAIIVFFLALVMRLQSFNAMTSIP